jgi:hypothetical protein
MSKGLASQLTAAQQSYYQQMMSSYLSGQGLGVMLGTGTIKTPQVPKALAVFGSYRVDTDIRLALYVGAEEKRVVCTWPRMPSRRAVAAAIVEDRLSAPRRNARDEYGALVGVKFFNVTGDYRLTSPVQGTVWNSSVLSAHSWDESEALRGVCGIHAAWPPRTWKRVPMIDSSSTDNVVAVVRGLGKFIAGEEGWRAEKVIVDRCFLPQSLYSRWRVLKRLAKLYPEISFEEEPWTLERSLKSAPSSLAKSR